MSYTSDSADQIVRYSLEGTEIALKLSGAAAKNFAIFAYTIFKDQYKTRGKTRLVRMLKEGKPLKFFTVPEDKMREFAREAKRHGLLFVPMRDKQNPGVIEIAVFAQDAAKINRIMDRMCLDFVKAAAGDAVPEPSDGKGANFPAAPSVQTETVETPNGKVEFVVGGFEDDFGIAGEDGANFTQGPVDAPAAGPQQKPSPSEPSSPSKSSSPMPSEKAESVPPSDLKAASPADRPSVRKELQEIRQEQAKDANRKMQERTKPAPQRMRTRTKKKSKGG